MFLLFSLTSLHIHAKDTERKDVTALIKNFMERVKDEVEIDKDRFPALIKEVETYAASTSNPVYTALLHSMAAEMYNSFYSRNLFTINQRTPIVGYIPEDVSEWTSNIFQEKIKEELKLSLRPAETLQSTPVSYFKDILKKGKDDNLRPTLFDFLVYRAIDIQPDEESFYNQLISFRKTQLDKKALILAELAYVDLLPNNNNAFDSLLNIYAHEEASVEIIISKIKRLQIFDNEMLRDSILYNLCKETIAKFPDYDRTNDLRNELISLQRPYIITGIQNELYPGKELSINVKYKNINNIKVEIYEYLQSPEKIHQYAMTSRDAEYRGKKIKRLDVALHKLNTYTAVDTIIKVGKIDKNGIYECIVSSSTDTTLFTSNLFFVSSLAAVSRNLASGQAEVFVADFNSGKPVKDAIVRLYSRVGSGYSIVDSVKTNNYGLATLPYNEKYNAYRAIHKDDVYMVRTNMYQTKSANEPILNDKQVSLFTDRGIYRPGQTIFFKGILYKADKIGHTVIPNKDITVYLYDTNNKEVSKKSFKSNDFGSFNGEFTLPQNTLNGTYLISAENSSTWFSVEEYKRPTFSVEILPIKEEYSYGDEIKVNGKAMTFSGVSLQDGKISYHVTRCPFFYRSFATSYGEERIAFGESILKEDGSFAFSFVASKDKYAEHAILTNRFEVTVTVTDSKGETQETKHSIAISDRSIMLTPEIRGDKVNKDNDSINITAKTINMESVSVNGRFSIVQLSRSDGKDKEVAVAATGQFSTSKGIDNKTLAKLESGLYKLKLEAVDSKGRSINTEDIFFLYSPKDKRPPVFQDIWLPKSYFECAIGEEATFIFGTSHKDAYVLYELVSDDKIVSRELIRFSNENKTFKIPFVESYGYGVIASFTFIKEGDMYSEQVRISKKESEKELIIKTETFRDKLMPGDKETWRFTVSNNDSTPASAEVLAGMYDASLDAIRPFLWNFSLFDYNYMAMPRFRSSSCFGINTQQNYVQQRNFPVSVPEYSRLAWPDELRMGYENSLFYMMPTSRALGLTVSQSKAMAGDVLFEEAVVVGYDEVQQTMTTQTRQSPIRINLNETAFFYPTLRTDKDGKFVIEFTLPENNTTWKLQTLAHTKDLNYGTLTKEVVSSKPVMVLPNIPRFVRIGDKTGISTQIINQSDKTIEGKVRLELFNPAKNETIASVSDLEKDFTIEAGKQTNVNWTFDVPTGIDLLGIRIVADTETASDGEQHMLPVLPNEILITESIPVYLQNTTEKTIPMPDKAGVRLNSVTFELTSNPIWYAVQALSTQASPSNDDILSWFASYYSNILAGKIVNANPRIKQVIDSWKAQGGSTSTLYSNLEKNHELKNILLEETPWVLQAENETERKQRLSTLFDTNRADNQKETALARLIQQQRQDGSWGWFRGFNPNKQMTLNIIKGMSQLTELNAIELNNAEREMLIKAIKYTDSDIMKDYNNLKNNKEIKNIIPSEYQLEYLFVRSSYRDIPEADAREAIKFYTTQAEKNWKEFSLLGKIQTAVLMHRNGNKNTATNILAWFKKTATSSEAKGMYWANNRATMSSTASPIETHTLIMSAFHEIEGKSKDVDKMKQWLLTQKRTQDWGTTPATLNAIHAILLTGSDQINESNNINVVWGEKTISSGNAETATGYMKESRAGDALSGKDQIIITKEGDAPAWGAVYFQYLSPIDKVEKNKTELNIEKKLFVERNTANGAQLVALNANDNIKVGDKVVVRLTVRNDQDMNYVHIKDIRSSCFEPAQKISGVEFREGTMYYHVAKDASENFFFDSLPKGTFVLEYSVHVSRSGEYSPGIATIQCMYAPEFVSNTEGVFSPDKAKFTVQ